MTYDRDSGYVTCDDCRTPAFQIKGNTLVIKHRHSGEKHTTVVSLPELIARLNAAVDNNPHPMQS